MFLVRGMVVCFSAFALVYISFSILVVCGWATLERVSRRFSARVAADALFTLRIFPMPAGLLVSLILVLPSFALLESTAIIEPIGAIPLVLGVAGMAFVAIGFSKVVVAQVRTSRLLEGWLIEATFSQMSGGDVLLARVPGLAPGISVARDREPLILISEIAAKVLSEPELHAALRHELVHIRRWDNLKKLSFQACGFPGMRGLEQAWLCAAEMAADQAAVCSSNEALDLASALVKLSRFGAHVSPADIALALASTDAVSLNSRVDHLVVWQKDIPRTRGFLINALILVSGTTLCLGATYGSLLVRLHAATEWLIRR
jgi:beta-lactamase regulating signal transducer with metallopeptidase domain